MGISKRFINEEQIINNLLKKTVSTLFKNTDIFVFHDEFSLRVYESYLLGLTDQELLLTFEKELINKL